MTKSLSQKNNQDTTNVEDAPYSPYAGVMKRGIATFIDAILLTIPYLFFLFYFSPVPLSLISKPEYKLEYLQFLQSIPVILTAQILAFLYFILQYRSKHQATFGMRLVDIRLTTEDTNKPSWRGLALRYFVYVIPFLTLSFLQKNNIIPAEFEKAGLLLTGITTIIVILMITFTKRKQTYYDMAAKTLVLQEPQETNPPFVYAGLGRRFFSYLVDLIVVLLLIGIAIYGLGHINPPKDSSSFSAFISRPSSFLIALILPFAYSVLQYRSKHQATLGMRVLNIKIMTTDYQKPSVKQLVLRYLIDVTTFLLPFINLLGAAMILFTDRKQAHYDKISKIIFVKISK